MEEVSYNGSVNTFRKGQNKMKVYMYMYMYMYVQVNVTTISPECISYYPISPFMRDGIKLSK